ncbi:hypothetical protein C8J57DRAFT_1319862 [Mycena rebaudengoi]|nr:hypothetical protein C8J57DRAFT_1377558 [Mycena rebaudengoi]KAJ7270829.1 hypothetical protein C8J57DRAFT_1319862 [Mycena rebaudengoi]
MSKMNCSFLSHDVFASRQDLQLAWSSTTTHFLGFLLTVHLLQAIILFSFHVRTSSLPTQMPPLALVLVVMSATLLQNAVMVSSEGSNIGTLKIEPAICCS